jgi:hypothetical protein
LAQICWIQADLVMLGGLRMLRMSMLSDVAAVE